MLSSCESGKTARESVGTFDALCGRLSYALSESQIWRLWLGRCERVRHLGWDTFGQGRQMPNLATSPVERESASRFHPLMTSQLEFLLAEKETLSWPEMYGVADFHFLHQTVSPPQQSQAFNLLLIDRNFLSVFSYRLTLETSPDFLSLSNLRFRECKIALCN